MEFAHVCYGCIEARGEADDGPSLSCSRSTFCPDGSVRACSSVKPVHFAALALLDPYGWRLGTSCLPDRDPRSAGMHQLERGWNIGEVPNAYHD